MEFESDIFISYAHLDNETAIDGQDGWVTSFHRALEVRVAQLLGEKPKIFRDPKLQGNDYFTDTLVEQLPKTAVLVSVFSPRYVKSEWCTRELAQFVDASAESGGLRLKDKARIFKVLKTPVPLDKQPDPVRPLLGYEFFKEDPDTKRLRELDKVFGPEAEQDFWKKLDDLAHDMAALLEAMKADADVPGAPGISAQGVPQGESLPMVERRRQSDRRKSEGREVFGAAGKVEAAVVYLAQASSDLKAEHEAVKRDLKQAGHTVLPEEPLPLEITELQAQTSQQLARCRLSIHLIGRKYGIVPEGTDQSLEVIQNDLAIERGKSGQFTRLVWIPRGLEAEDERQSGFIEKLRSDPRTQQGADLLEVPLEDLKIEIRKNLAAANQAPPEAAANSTESSGLQVYLICDQRDLHSVSDVENCLFDQGYEVTLPAFEGDETEVRENHEENLRDSDAALVYYGQGNDLWLQRKLKELKRAAGLGRREPWRAQGVLVAPPGSAEKRCPRSHGVIELRQPEEAFSAETILPFLTALAKGSG